ncbi:MAG TPA: endonuclease/exonuclease/phosphatase family protein [Chryseolinea sp.]
MKYFHVTVGKYFHIAVAIFLSIIYLSGLVPPTRVFNLWITSFVIPVALLINHVLLIIFLVLRKRSAVFYLGSLLIGIPYLTSTIGVKHLLPKRDMDGQTLSVMNYNMGVYSTHPYRYTNRDSARLALKNWILNSESDIKCIQEFANIPWSKEFNLIDRLEAGGLHYYFSTDDKDSKRDHFKNGTLIISKYPIIESGDVLSSRNGFNRIAYADIKVKEDTIRVVNVHLQSMGLGENNPRHTRDLNTLKNQVYTILRKLRTGVFERSRQVRQLSDFIERSPYPVICAGDFNDLPYSYNYRHLRNRMKNSFEESGKGFGFTYSGGTLKLLRIDNQFYSSGLHSVGFETLDNIKLSDHFPLRGEYVIQK